MVRHFERSWARATTGWGTFGSAARGMGEEESLSAARRRVVRGEARGWR